MSTSGFAQVARQLANGQSELSSMRNCARPSEVKRAKVMEFDPGRSFVKVAVELATGRFKVVRIKVLDRPEDPRPLAPVIEAARITQGKLQFYTPHLNADPQPVHERDFVVVAALGGTQVCWATSGSLIKIL